MPLQPLSNPNDLNIFYTKNDDEFQYLEGVVGTGEGTIQDMQSKLLGDYGYTEGSDGKQAFKDWWETYKVGPDETDLNAPVYVADLAKGKYYNDGLQNLEGVVNSERTGTKPAWLANGDMGYGGGNILDDTAVMATQNATTVAMQYTLGFKGTGTVTLTGTSTSGPLVGTGADDLVTLDFTPTAGTLTLTVSGSVTVARLYPSGYGGMQPNPDMPSDPTYFPVASGEGPYFAPAIAYDPVTLAATKRRVMEGNNTTRLNTHPVCKDGTGWQDTGATSTNLSLDYLSVFDGVSVASLGASWHRLIASTGAALTNSAKHPFQVLYRAGTSGNARIAFDDITAGTIIIIDGVVGSLSVSTSTAGTITELQEVLLSDGLTYLMSGYLTANTSNAYKAGIGPDSSTSGETVIALGAFIGGAGEKLPHCPIIGGDGSAATVVKDVFSVGPVLQDAVNVPFLGFDKTQGTFVFKGEWVHSAAGNKVMLAGDHTTRYIYQAGTEADRSRGYDGVGIPNAPAGSFTTNEPAVAVSSYLEGGAFNVLGNGSAEGSVSLTGDLYTDTLDIGHLAGAEGMHGILDEILYYNVQLGLTTRQGFSV